jgi:hypothetical protein
MSNGNKVTLRDCLVLSVWKFGPAVANTKSVVFPVDTCMDIPASTSGFSSDEVEGSVPCATKYVA